jgi:mediator of RNA polymerase II transcription subunit 14
VSRQAVHNSPDIFQITSSKACADTSRSLSSLSCFNAPYASFPYSLPSSPIQHRPRLIIDFAKTQRQSFLKYLAILRWKSTVDVPARAAIHETSTFSSTVQQIHSIPTPITNGSYGGSTDNSPAAGYIGKGKGRAVVSDSDDRNRVAMSRGRVTDAKRVQVLMEHQNRQHEMALHHISAALSQVESLRYAAPKYQFI